MTRPRLTHAAPLVAIENALKPCVPKRRDVVFQQRMYTIDLVLGPRQALELFRSAALHVSPWPNQCALPPPPQSEGGLPAATSLPHRIILVSCPAIISWTLNYGHK